MRKEFAIGSDARLQIRLEAFNVFNRTRFGLPVSAYGDPLFGNVEFAGAWLFTRGGCRSSRASSSKV